MTIKREHLVFGALGALFIFVALYESLLFLPATEGMHMDNHSQMHSFMAGQMGPSLLGFNLLFWIFLIILVYVLVRPPSAASSESTAVKILDERYAKGDITREEYLEKLKDLKDT